MTVLVIGNCTVDICFSVPRFPRPGETVLATGRQSDLGGKGANQAVAARRFGADVRLVAMLGRDADGDWAAGRLAAEGLDPSTLLRGAAGTDQSILYLTPTGENCIVSTHAAAAAVTPSQALAAVAAVPPATTLLMQGNLPADTTRAALEAGRAAGLRTLINPAPIQYGYGPILAAADIAVVNAIEARELGGADDPLAAAAAIRAAGAGAVIVTLGAAGAVLVDRDGHSRFPAPPVAAIDTVGAGDTFCGALAARLDRGAALASAIALAVEAAALTVTRRGTQTSFPSTAEAAALLARHPG